MGVHLISDMTCHWWGWRPWMWKLRPGVTQDHQAHADVGPVPAILPGTVQAALLQAGIIKDWHLGTSSVECEWVEHRHWELLIKVFGSALAGARRIVLDAEGLDYSGWILIDGREVAAFRGALVPSRMDLTSSLFRRPGSLPQHLVRRGPGRAGPDWVHIPVQALQTPIQLWMGLVSQTGAHRGHRQAHP